MTTIIKAGRHSIEITHPDRIIFPKNNITKLDLVSYYRDIAPIMVPHMKNRPVTMLRFPERFTGESFYHKEAPDYFPSWIARATVKKEGGVVHHVLCQNEATLVYLANQGCLTPHIWLSKINNINYPDRMIFDLDPSDNDFTTARKIALELREYLVDFGLHPFVMTTGSRGLHVVSPLKPTCTFDEVRSFARDLADYCAAKNGKKVTTAVRKEKRKGRLFIDTARNSYAATGVAPYAVRAVPGACVATPIEWDEVEDSKLKPGRYTIKNIFKRLDSHGDVWHAINAHATSLKKAQKKLAKLL